MTIPKVKCKKTARKPFDLCDNCMQNEIVRNGVTLKEWKIRKAINLWLKKDVESIKAKEEPISKLIEKLMKELR